MGLGHPNASVAIRALPYGQLFRGPFPTYNEV